MTKRKRSKPAKSEKPANETEQAAPEAVPDVVALDTDIMDRPVKPKEAPGPMITGESSGAPGGDERVGPDEMRDRQSDQMADELIAKGPIIEGVQNPETEPESEPEVIETPVEGEVPEESADEPAVTDAEYESRTVFDDDDETEQESVAEKVEEVEGVAEEGDAVEESDATAEPDVRAVALWDNLSEGAKKGLVGDKATAEEPRIPTEGTATGDITSPAQGEKELPAKVAATPESMAGPDALEAKLQEFTEQYGEDDPNVITMKLMLSERQAVASREQAVSSAAQAVVSLSEKMEAKEAASDRMEFYSKALSLSVASRPKVTNDQAQFATEMITSQMVPLVEGQNPYDVAFKRMETMGMLSDGGKTASGKGGKKPQSSRATTDQRKMAATAATGTSGTSTPRVSGLRSLQADDVAEQMTIENPMFAEVAKLAL